MWMGAQSRAASQVAQAVVGVVVGDDDAADGAAVGGEHGVPGVPGVGRGVAAVDDDHAVAVVEQPQVDVVEREGRRMRTQRTPGATSSVVPGSGAVSKG